MSAAIMLIILAVTAVALLAVLPVIYRAGYRRGKLDGQFAAQHQQLDERWAGFGERIAEAGKHRAGQPRTSGARDDTRSRSSHGEGQPVIDRRGMLSPRAAGAAQTRGAQPPGPRTPRIVTAVGIAPVVLPEDGTVIPLRHQPAPAPDHPTTAMPKLTDTGELRARTDKQIMRMREDTEAWLAETRLT